jgi:hypothetical protein
VTTAKAMRFAPLNPSYDTEPYSAVRDFLI